MKSILYIILACATLLTSCRSKESAVEAETIYAPTHADGFSVVRVKSTGERMLRITNPWQGAKGVVLDYSLDKPAHRIVAMSSSHVAMLDAIGCTDHIVGVSGAKFISTPSVAERIKRGEVAEVGFDGAIDFEVIKSLKADLVMLYGVSSEEKGITNKLDELGIPYIYIGEYLETRPLGKTEWMIAFGHLCGKEKESAKVFHKVEKQYITIRKTAQSMKRRPLVMLNTPYRDTWFMPSTKSYMVRLIHDANGEYVYKENDSDSTRPISMEEALLLTEQAEFWINVGHHRNIESLCEANPLFLNVSAIRNRRVYNNTRRDTPDGGSDFWESGAVRPDLILSDLVKILHEGVTNESLYYYEQLQ